LFSTVATFGTALDVTIAELAIESFFPADAATAGRLMQAGALVTRTTRETVEELLLRVAGGDPEEISRLYADHVAWRLDWPPGDYSKSVPWICDRSTPAGVVEHFRLIADHHVGDRSSATVSAIVVDGDDAVVLGELRNTARPTGRRNSRPQAVTPRQGQGLHQARQVSGRNQCPITQQREKP